MEGNNIGYDYGFENNYENDYEEEINIYEPYVFFSKIKYGITDILDKYISYDEDEWNKREMVTRYDFEYISKLELLLEIELEKFYKGQIINEDFRENIDFIEDKEIRKEIFNAKRNRMLYNSNILFFYKHSYKELTNWINNKYKDRDLDIEKEFKCILNRLNCIVQRIKQRMEIFVKNDFSDLYIYHTNLDKMKLKIIESKNNYYSANENLNYKIQMDQFISSEIDDLIEFIKINIENRMFYKQKLDEINFESTKLTEKIESTKDEFKKNKFDVLSLMSLVFAAFSIVLVNIASFGSIKLGALDKNNFLLVILTISFINITILSSIITIFSLIEKLYSKENYEYKVIAIILGVYILLLVLTISFLSFLK